MLCESIEFNGKKYAEIIRAHERVDSTIFCSPPENSFQFGLLAHKKGFIEAPHSHKKVSRLIEDLHQMFVVQRGVVAIDFYTEEMQRFQEVILREGDAIVLMNGIHGVRVLEDMQCVSVKQGPFLGANNDKVSAEGKNL